MRISAVTIFTQVVLYHINKDTWKGDRFMIYAAADIEWVGLNSKKPVQLGAVLIDENGREISRYYCVIKPPAGSEWRNIEFMGISEKMLEKAVSLTSAVKAFFSFTQNCSEIYVWSRESELLLDSLRNGFCPEFRTEISAVQGSPQCGMASFEKTCQKLDITITKQLHNSMNDCEYLAEMLRRMKLLDKPSVQKTGSPVGESVLKYAYRQENYAPISECEFAAIKGRTVFHYPQCRFIAGRSDNELEGFFDYFHAAMNGLKPCKCCRPTKKHPKPSSTASPSKQTKAEAKWNTDSIIQKCGTLGIKCTVYENIIYIYTGVSEWYFHRNVGKIRIYHENWLRKENQTNWASGFHIQNKTFNDPIDAVFYIYCHDKKMKYANEKMMQE